LECPTRQAHITLDTSPTRHPLAPPTSTPVIMPTTTVPRLTPDVTAELVGTALARDICVRKYKARLPPPSCRLWRPSRHCTVAPRCAAPRGSGVMLDQPRAHARMGSIPENKYPTGMGSKRKREPSPTYGKNYPPKKDSPLSRPHTVPAQISRGPRSYAPTRLPSPSHYPCRPVTEETDLRVQQVPWEGRDVTIPAVTPTFPHQCPRLP